MVWSGKMEIPTWKGTQLSHHSFYCYSICRLASPDHNISVGILHLVTPRLYAATEKTRDYGMKWKWGHLRDVKISCPPLCPRSLALSFSNLLNSRMLFHPKLQLTADVIPEGMPFPLPITVALQHVQQSCQWVLQPCKAPPDFFLELLRHKNTLSCTKRLVNPPFPQLNTKLYFFLFNLFREVTVAIQPPSVPPVTFHVITDSFMAQCTSNPMGKAAIVHTNYPIKTEKLFCGADKGAWDLGEGEKRSEQEKGALLGRWQ